MRSVLFLLAACVFLTSGVLAFEGEKKPKSSAITVTDDNGDVVKIYKDRIEVIEDGHTRRLMKNSSEYRKWRDWEGEFTEDMVELDRDMSELDVDMADLDIAMEALGEAMEDLGREMEGIGEALEDAMADLDIELEHLDTEMAKLDLEMETLDYELDALHQAIAREMLRDGLLEVDESLDHIRISDDGVWLNKNKLDRKMEKKYRSLIKDATNFHIEGSFEINLNN